MIAPYDPRGLSVVVVVWRVEERCRKSSKGMMIIPLDPSGFSVVVRAGEGGEFRGISMDCGRFDEVSAEIGGEFSENGSWGGKKIRSSAAGDDELRKMVMAFASNGICDAFAGPAQSSPRMTACSVVRRTIGARHFRLPTGRSAYLRQGPLCADRLGPVQWATWAFDHPGRVLASQAAGGGWRAKWLG